MQIGADAPAAPVLPRLLPLQGTVAAEVCVTRVFAALAAPAACGDRSLPRGKCAGTRTAREALEHQAARASRESHQRRRWASAPLQPSFMTARGFNHGSPWLKPREVMNGVCGASNPDLRRRGGGGGGEARTGRLGVQRGSEVSEARPELRELLASVCSAGLGVRVLAGSVPRQPTDPTCMERLSG